MRILLIGKLPPIEGGVSAQTFWLARSLARQGHEVNAVTNALEVEPTLRQFHEDPDAEWLTVNHPGRLRVYYTERVTRDSYIPFAAPYLNQLFGLSLEVIERHGCDVIIGWYFEPYGLTAAMVAQTTGLPFFVRHAGSDLGRLSQHANLRSSYRWMLNAATGLMVTNEQELEVRFGIIETPRLDMLRPSLPNIFDCESTPLDVDASLVKATAWFQQVGLSADVLKKIQAINGKPFPKGVFTIGVYGKVGLTKGNFDLLTALGELARKGMDFVLLTMSCGWPATLQQYYEAILDDEEVSRRTWVLPPLAPWRVPSLLAQCQATAFLERGFSISSHGPMIPFEILSSGSCLVCSAEVATKPFYRGNLVNNRNAIIIEDPRNREALSEILFQVINDWERSKSIGIQGRKLYQFFAEDLCSQDESAAGLLAQIADIMKLNLSEIDAKQKAPVISRTHWD